MRIVQHRKSRSEKGSKRELAELRRQNRQLLERSKRLAEQVEEKPKSKKPTPRTLKIADEPKPLPACPCGSNDVRSLVLGNHGTWKVCADCKARSKQAA
jgi:hypothetical protein